MTVVYPANPPGSLRRLRADLIHNPQRLRPSILRPRHLPAHHDIIRPRRDRFRRCRHSLLIPRRCPRRPRIPRSPLHQLRRAARVSVFREIRIVQARQHAHRQQLQRRIASTLYRRPHHLSRRVNRHEIRPELHHLRYRALHRLADVVQLQIQKHAVTLRLQFPHELRTRRREQLQADLIEVRRFVDRPHQPASFLRARHIQRDNDRRLALVSRSRHITRSGFAPRPSTRPMTYADGYLRRYSSASGSAISSPPDVCGSYNSGSTGPALSTQLSTKSRLLFNPPGIAPAFAYSSAPSRNRTRAVSISRVTPLPIAISRACPSNPKPVTSVTL